jgi:hypothetical protein
MTLNDEIAKVAYELFERDGRQHGKDQEHWLEAERIVHKRKNTKKVDTKTKKAKTSPLKSKTSKVLSVKNNQSKSSRPISPPANGGKVTKIAKQRVK